MPMADEEFPWDHRASNVVPLRDDEPVDYTPPAYMDDVPPYEGEGQKDDGPLPGVADPSTWGTEKAPIRRFIIPGWIVRGAAGLLSGQEGVGKSLLAQQMATCAAIGHSFLGLEIEQVNAVYITCEDPMDELRRRQEGINASLGITMADLEGKLKLVSLTGEIGNELATFTSDARLVLAKRYRQIHKEVTEFGAGLTFLDNAAHFFTGNENARHDVASFLGLLERLSIATDGAVVLLAHPNKQHAQGNTQGNEYSGSTGWSAHVRNRLFLDWAKEDADGNPMSDDGRLLRKSKANYGKKGEEIHFIWHEWAFTTLSDLPGDTGRQIARAAEDGALNDIFLACLDKATEERRNVSGSGAASNYAPRAFLKMTLARGIPLAKLEEAMNRLFHLEYIRNDQPLWQRKNRVWVTGISRTEKCTNPRTNHAPSGAPSSHQPHEAPSGFCTNPQPTHTPSTTYIGEGSDDPPHELYGEGPPAWMDEAPPIEPDWHDNPILNHDNTGKNS
jgi:RecA-family ATPase